jgi:hypothetical protein
LFTTLGFLHPHTYTTPNQIQVFLSKLDPKGIPCGRSGCLDGNEKRRLPSQIFILSFHFLRGSFVFCRFYPFCVIGGKMDYGKEARWTYHPLLTGDSFPMPGGGGGWEKDQIPDWLDELRQQWADEIESMAESEQANFVFLECANPLFCGLERGGHGMACRHDDGDGNTFFNSYLVFFFFRP